MLHIKQCTSTQTRTHIWCQISILFSHACTENYNILHILTGTPAGRNLSKLWTGMMKQSLSKVARDIGSVLGCVFVTTTVFVEPLKLTCLVVQGVGKSELVFRLTETVFFVPFKLKILYFDLIWIFNTIVYNIVIYPSFLTFKWNVLKYWLIYMCERSRSQY